MRTAPSGRRYPQDKQEYTAQVQRRLKEAITALEAVEHYDFLVDSQLMRECTDLLNEAGRAKLRLAAMTPGMNVRDFDGAIERVHALDAATDELKTLVQGRIRLARAGEGEEETDR